MREEVKIGTRRRPQFSWPGVAGSSPFKHIYQGKQYFTLHIFRLWPFSVEPIQSKRKAKRTKRVRTRGSTSSSPSPLLLGHNLSAKQALEMPACLSWCCTQKRVGRCFYLRPKNKGHLVCFEEEKKESGDRMDCGTARLRARIDYTQTQIFQSQSKSNGVKSREPVSALAFLFFLLFALVLRFSSPRAPVCFNQTPFLRTSSLYHVVHIYTAPFQQHSLPPSLLPF